jgi:hypothetical protein
MLMSAFDLFQKQRHKFRMNDNDNFEEKAKILLS